jgi:voltage-gated potassium channel Kch
VDSAGLAAAGIAEAAALICADDDDALNLEIALLARQLNPDVGPHRELLDTLHKGQPVNRSDDPAVARRSDAC